jgi:general secretion pathway protein G
MRQRIQAVRKNDNGFTLIELLIVVVILGVLAGITVFAVAAFSNDGVLAACKTDKKNVEVASEAFFAKTGGRAANVTALVTANYLKEEPSSTKYTITYDPLTGNVTGAVASPAAAC